MNYSKNINNEFNRALNLFNNNSVDEAEKILQELYIHNPEISKVNELLAYIYGKKGLKNKCLELLIKSCSDQNCSAEANYYLGMAYLESNQLELAIYNFEISLKKGGDFIEGLINLGVAKARKKDKNGALITFNKALSIQENNTICLLNIGKLYIELTKYRESLPCFKKVILLNHRCSEAYLELANAFYNLKDYDNSLSYYDEYLKFDLQDYLPFFNKGVIYRELGKYDDAISCLQMAHNLEPRNIKTIIEIALLFIDQRKYDAAIKIIELGLSYEKNNTEILSTLGLIHQAQNNFQTALSIYDNLLSSSENLISILIRKGNLLSENLKFELALDCFNKVLIIEPENLTAKIGMGNICNYKSDYFIAIKFFKDVLKTDPNNFEANLNISYSYFQIKNFPKGWYHYDWRWVNRNLASPKLDSNKPTWSGETRFETLYIWYEQGMGEQIICSSVFRHLKNYEGRIIISLPSKLIPLYERSYPKILFISDLNCRDFDFDYQISIFGLMEFFVSTFDSIRNVQINSLVINTFQKNQLLQKHTISNKKICGVSWLSFNSSIGKNKSISFNQIKPIINNKKYSFINLQHGITKEDVSPSDLICIEEVNLYDDIDSVASLISMCDIVITISNTIAHLAGSLNIKTYLLLPYGRGRLWYWLETNGKSVFYPSVTVFNQTNLGDWNEPINKINDLLDKN